MKLPRLSPGQRRTVYSLVKNECCNYIDGNCLLLDDGEEHCCPQLISYSLLCQYFRKAVLPLNAKLDAKLFPEKYTLCLDCKQPYIKAYHNQLYCRNCATLRKRRQTAVCVHNYREKSKKSTF